MNNFTIMGRLTKDPETKTMQSGTSLTSFSVAVEDRFIQNGEKKVWANFYDLQAWGKQGEIISQYFSKGDRILTSGQIKQERWEKDGKFFSKIVFIVREFSFIESKKDSSGNQAEPEIHQENGDMPF